jgi:4'-phosphopantetheinyl transferase
LSSSPVNDAGGPTANFWLMDGSRVQDDDLRFFAAQIGASEAGRFTNFVRPERRRQFLLGRLLLRIAIADLTGLPVSEIHVIERAGKTPELMLSKRQNLAPKFNLSHSREWVACVTSLDATLGLDIEVIDSNRDVVGISEIAFHSMEHAWLLSQPPAERVSAFYSLWCAKEAMYKLRCNLGGELGTCPLIGDDGSATFSRENWYQNDLTAAHLSLVVFSDRQLSNIRNIRLTRLSPADPFG